MKGEQLEFEQLAAAVRREAGLEEDDFALATDIAASLLGPNSIVFDAELQGVAYLRRRSDGRFEIVLRPDAPDLRFRIMHECAHVALRANGHTGMLVEDEERAANHIAAAIMAPAQQLERAHGYFGNDLRRLKPISTTFGLSQTSVHLRLGDVLGDDRAIVTARNENVLSRGGLWITVPVLQVARGERRLKDIAKAKLRGGIDEGRIALRGR